MTTTIFGTRRSRKTIGWPVRGSRQGRVEQSTTDSPDLVYGCYTPHLMYGCYTTDLVYGCYTSDLMYGWLYSTSDVWMLYL